MPLQLTYSSRDLQFKFNAKTSRGSLQLHRAYYLKLSNTDHTAIFGIGEAAPLAGLSIDAIPDFEAVVARICREFTNQKFSETAQAISWFNALDLSLFPALRFGIETALLDYKNGGKRMLYDNTFSQGEAGIPINGLIWMGDRDFMQTQISSKLKEGYSCLKLKIGGLHFEEELEILAAVREVAPASELTIRLDANGAFAPQNAMQKLEKLAALGIHSIEQPIKQGQTDAMKTLCANSPIPIALDEELIGITKSEDQCRLLEKIKPVYIILKPTLVGGLQETQNWINLAKGLNIGWWLTSALESNIGLNAIAQFTAQFKNLIPQGLGTGQLYHNNISSPLIIKKGYLFYEKTKTWETLTEIN